jgi:integrase
MPILVLNTDVVPRQLASPVCVRRSGIPRFYATIWADILKGSLRPSTRRGHLSSLNTFYDAVDRQFGSDCLDQLIADGDFDRIEECLIGFLAQLRNEAVIRGIDRGSAWASFVTFVIDMLRYRDSKGQANSSQLSARLLRLNSLFDQLQPNPGRPQPSIRALPPVVIEDLCAIFDPYSPRNPFKSEDLRWRNLLVFMLMFRLGLRRGETALLAVDSFKEDFDPAVGTQRCIISCSCGGVSSCEQTSTEVRCEANQAHPSVTSLPSE